MMINVVHVITDTNIGGAGQMLLTYLRRMDRNEFDIAVIVPEGAMLIPELEKTGVKVYPLKHIADKSYSRRAILGLRNVFKVMKPDIVHTHAAFSARVAARVWGKCKIIHTRHSVFDQPAYKKRFPVKQILGFLNNHYSDIIIAVSPAAKDNIVETGTNPKKIAVIYNGVEPLAPLTETEKKCEFDHYGLEFDDFICTIAARLVPEKGHDYILEAAAKLQAELPQVKVIIAGTGPQEEHLKSTASKMGLGNVIFAGFVTDVRKLFGITHILLNASYGTEATSLSLLEGMSLGLPIIASDFGGNPYVVEHGETGLLYPKNNSTALFEAIADLCADGTKYKCMSIEAKQRFEEMFTAEKMVNEIEQVYKSLL